jgi:uncharacterized protein YfkK (UPF0435 family)
MRNTINVFLEEAPLWQVFVALFLIMTVITFPLFFMFTELTESEFNLGLQVKLSVSIGVLFGAIGTSLTYLSRKSGQFWDFAERLECKVEDADCKESLDLLYNTDFQVLKNMSFGHPHYEELRKIHTIIKTKYKYVK